MKEQKSTNEADQSQTPILKVKIQETDYVLGRSKKGELMWEMMFNKSIFYLDLANIAEVYYLLYQLLKCKNKNFEYSFEDFIDISEIESTFNGLELIFGDSVQGGNNDKPLKDI